jgi:hypothetical protein
MSSETRRVCNRRRSGHPGRNRKPSRIRRFGWLFVPSAEEFIARRRDSGAACLVCDVRLPGMSGLELQKVLSREKATSPVVFISGYGDNVRTSHARRGGQLPVQAVPLPQYGLADKRVDGGIRCWRSATWQGTFG